MACDIIFPEFAADAIREGANVEVRLNESKNLIVMDFNIGGKITFEVDLVPSNGVYIGYERYDNTRVIKDFSDLLQFAMYNREVSLDRGIDIRGEWINMLVKYGYLQEHVHKTYTAVR